MSTPTRIVVLLTMLLCSFVVEGDDPASDFVRFFPDDAVPESVLRTFLASGSISEYRIVSVNIDALRQAIRDAQTTGDSENRTIVFPLIDESIISIEIRAADEHHDGWKSGIAQLRGSVEGDEYSMVQGTFAPDGSAHLTIRAGGQRYAIRKSSVLPYHFYYTLNFETGSKKID